MSVGVSWLIPARSIRSSTAVVAVPFMAVSIALGLVNTLVSICTAENMHNHASKTGIKIRIKALPLGSTPKKSPVNVSAETIATKPYTSVDFCLTNSITYIIPHFPT